VLVAGGSLVSRLVWHGQTCLLPPAPPVKLFKLWSCSYSVGGAAVGCAAA
jgi:hypothetical protein